MRFWAVQWEESEAHRNVTAEVLTEATVGIVSAKNFQFFLKRKPHLALPPQKTFGGLVKRYLNWRSGKSGNLNLVSSCRKPRPRTTNPLLNIAFRSPASRLALLLQNRADAPKQGVRMLRTVRSARYVTSDKEVGETHGSSVENMEALLNQFKQHGIIEKRYRRIQILDPWQLKKLLTQGWEHYRLKPLKVKRIPKLMNKKNPYLQLDRQMVGDIYTSQEVMDNLTVLCDEYGARFAGTPRNLRLQTLLQIVSNDMDSKTLDLRIIRMRVGRVARRTLEVIEPIRRTLHCISLPYCPLVI